MMARDLRAIHPSYKWKVLLTVAFGTFLATLDGSIVTMAFPELTRVFQADLTTVMWVTVVYILVSSGIMLAFGKLGDSIGKKKIYTAGLWIFTFGMFACGLARSIDQMILFRVVQGLGAAMSIGCGAAIVTEAFPPEELGKGLGMLGVAVSLGFIVGPVTGGILLDWFDWRAIFYMRVPLGVLASVMAMFILEKDAVQAGKTVLDIPGTLTSFTGLFCLLYGMGQVKTSGLTSPPVVVSVSAGIAALCLFIIIEKRAKAPILDLGLFRDRTFSCAIAGLFLFFLAAPLYGVIMPFFLMDAIGLTPGKAGLLLSALPMATMIASPVGGAFSDRFGPRWPSTLGACAVAGSFFCMLRFDLQTETWAIALPLTLLGLGAGAFQPPNNSTIMGSAEQARLGSVSALVGATRQAAVSIGMALTGSVFSVRQGEYQDLLRLEGFDASQLLRHSLLPAFRDVVLVTLFLVLAVAILSSIPPAPSRSAVGAGAPPG